jgi:hypothetical protein
MAALENLARNDDQPFELLCDQSNLRTQLTLCTHESAEEAAARMEAYLLDHPNSRFSGLACWRAYRAGGLLRQGKPHAARELLEASLADPRFGALGLQVSGRTKLAMAEVLRLTGGDRDLGEARRLATGVIDGYRRESFDGPLAEIGLLQLAKIRRRQGAAREAVGILGEAYALQARLSHPAALRSVLLLARFDDSLTAAGRDQLRAEARKLTHERSAYRACPLARKIIEVSWASWTSRSDDPDLPGAEDDCWGV